MNNNRIQHIVPGSLVLLLAVTVAWLSFTREPADAFLFPRLIASVMLILALWNFVRAVTGLARVGSGITAAALLKITPGLLVTVVYVFYAAKTFGFYAASTVVFFCLFSIYDSASHKSAVVWLKTSSNNSRLYGGYLLPFYIAAKSANTKRHFSMIQIWIGLRFGGVYD